MPSRTLPLCLTISLAFATQASAAIDFAHQIVPILRKHCADCHLGEKQKGGLSMNTRESLLAGSENGPVVEPGKPASAQLLSVLVSDDPDAMMPPKGDRVSPAEIALLRQWIDEGLVWEPGFTFGKSSYEPPLKPRAVTLPAAQDGRSHPIDRIIDHYLADHAVPQPVAVDDRSFARRASLDLLGLLPDPASVEALVASTAEDKRQRFIADLLARDIDYAEHWITFWNDLLRNDHVGTGYIENGRKRITHWLYQSLIANKPYDQFARELLAPSPDSEGFIFGIKWRGRVNASQEREIQFAQSISQVFLGINMKCASCHDSFIDRWKLDQAYALAAIYADRPLEISRCDKPTGKMASAAWIFPELGEINAKAPQPERLQQLAGLMTHRENGRFTRTLANRLWHRLMGRGIVHPVDSMGNEPWSADLLDHLANQLVTDGYDVKKLLTHIATSQAYQSVIDTRPEPIDSARYTYQGPLARRLTAEQFTDAVWALTHANTPAPHATVLRGKPNRSAQPSAQWIWNGPHSGATQHQAGQTLSFRHRFQLPAKPTSAALVLTADNEYSAYLNGKAIGANTDLFSVETYPVTTELRGGQNELIIVAKNAGSGPNLAGLLAELRVSLPEGKAQAIATDTTWQWSTAKPDAKGKFATEPTDWQNAVIIKGPAAWKALETKDFTAAIQQATATESEPAAPGKPRALATQMRAALAPSDLLQRGLGRPNREQIVSVRPENLTTLEAIDLENGGILANYLKKGGNYWLKQYPNDPAKLIASLVPQALSRPATQPEQELLASLLGDKPTAQHVEDLLWSLLLLPEFQFVR